MTAAKKRWLVSTITLVVCFAMLIGTTFAWFTDKVTSGKNTIVAGNLDVELEYYNGAEWAPVTTSTKLFKENALWEPGYTEVAYLKISNIGTLALKYTLGINIENEVAGTNKDGSAFKLSDYIKMGVVEDFDGETFYATRDEAREAVTDAANIKNYAKSGEMIKGAPAQYLAIVVFMPEEVENVANHKTGTTAPSIDLGLELVASQKMEESDSFGNDYDNMEIATDNPGIETIFEAMTKKYEEGTEGTVIPSEIVVQEPVDVKPVTVKKGGDTEPHNYATEIDGAITTINLMDTMTAVGNDRYDINAAMRIQGQSGRQSVVTFKGNENGKFTNVGSGLHSLIYFEGDSIVNFESGIFETNNRIITANILGGPAATQKINVTGGTFIFSGKNKDSQAVFASNFIYGPMPAGAVTVTGGIFYNCDPSSAVPTGYHVASQVVDNDKIFTVVAD